MTVSPETTMLPESVLSIRSPRGTTRMSSNYSLIMRTLKNTELSMLEVMKTIFLMVETKS